MLSLCGALGFDIAASFSAHIGFRQKGPRLCCAKGKESGLKVCVVGVMVAMGCRAKWLGLPLLPFTSRTLSSACGRVPWRTGRWVAPDWIHWIVQSTISSRRGVQVYAGKETPRLLVEVGGRACPSTHCKVNLGWHHDDKLN